MTSTIKKLKAILFSIIAAIATILACFVFVGCGGIDMPTTDKDSGISTPNDTDDNTDNDNNGGGNNNNDNNDNNGNNDDKPPELVYTEGLAYEKIKDGEFVVGYSVIGIGDAKDTKIVIPDEYEEKPVTAIAEKAFEDCYKITQVILPGTITSIGKDAFYGCEKLEYNEYGDCKYLGTLDNPYLALVRPAADTITECGVHKDAAVIAVDAFKNCYDLASVDYSGTITDWCKIEFKSLQTNPLYRAHDLYMNGKKVTELKIPATITEIPQYAFAGISASKVVFPNGLTKVRAGAFNESALTAVNIIGSDGLMINGTAFEKCGKLKTLSITADGLYIDYAAFSDCVSLTTVKLTGDGMKIGNSFMRCNAISTVDIKGDNVLIRYGAFKELDSLTTVTLIGDGMDIGSFSFSECPELALLNLDSIPSKIDSFAFSQSLKRIKFTGNKAAWSLINKDKYWAGFRSMYQQSITVECTDGTVTEYRS